MQKVIMMKRIFPFILILFLFPSALIAGPGSPPVGPDTDLIVKSATIGTTATIAGQTIAVTVPAAYIFANDTARDEYFDGDPAAPTNLMWIVSNSIFQQYVTDTWVSHQTIMQGPTGATGAAGAAGVDGADGDSAYCYLAYASADDGTGFTTTFSASLDYIAVKCQATEIVTPQASDFAGLWKNYKGATGAQGPQGDPGAQGDPGTAGVDAYVYVAYASDGSRTGFNLTPSDSLKYRAEIHSATEIAVPDADDFAAATWVKYIGDDGADGAGAGDMLKEDYDSNDDGEIDDGAIPSAITRDSELATAVPAAETDPNWPRQEDCSGITSGCCLDTNDGKLYCYDGDSVECANCVDTVTFSSTGFLGSDNSTWFDILPDTTTVEVYDDAGQYKLRVKSGVYQAVVAEGTLADSVIVSADIKNGEVAGEDLATSALAPAINSKAAAYTVGTDAAKECYGGMIYVTSAAVITACDGLASGMSFAVKTVGAIAVSVDPQSDDLMILDGTAGADGEAATNLSTAGDMIVCTYYDATGWDCTSNGWTLP